MNIHLIVIRTAQPQKLADFYTLLDLEFVYHQHGNGAWHYSSSINKTVFEIYPLLKDQSHADNSLRLGFEVNNLEESIAKLKEENIEIINPPQNTEWGYIAIIKDLDGRKIELKEKVISTL